MSHDNDFPENHDAPRTRTHARPRPAKKPLAAQEGQRIPTRRADEHACPVETPGRSSEPRTPRAQAPTDSRAPHTHAPAEQRMPTSRRPIDPHARRAHVPAERRSSRNQAPGARASMSRPSKTAFAIAGVCAVLALVLFGVVHWQNARPHRHHGKRPATAAASHRNR